MTNYRIFYFRDAVALWYDFRAENDESAKEAAKKIAREGRIVVSLLMNRDEPRDLHFRFDPSKEVVA